MDVASASLSIAQSGARNALGTVVLKSQLDGEKATADLLAQAARTASSGSSRPPAAGLGQLVDLTV